MKKINIRKPKADSKGKPQDYRTYTMSGREIMITWLIYLAAALLLSVLFYNAPLFTLLLLPGGFAFQKYRCKSLAGKRRDRLRDQFLTGMQMVTTALRAGYAIENAFGQANGELRGTYGKDEAIIEEFSRIVSLVRLNYPIETLLLDLGERSDVEDIRAFAEVFAAARRSGGDLLTIIGNTIRQIGQKAETHREIETILAGKQMELNIMSAAPIAILAYVRVTSPELLGNMYGNVQGIGIMTVCLGIYGAAFFWGKRILDIEV